MTVFNMFSVTQKPVASGPAIGYAHRGLEPLDEMENAMKWSTPKVVEICIGMEINDYFPAEL
jgi:coenzyme PQQ precursor peptide PqqA